MVVATLGVVVMRVASGARANEFVRVDDITVAMLALIALVGWVVIRYSAVYLAGDPQERRYVQRMLVTLSAVSLVVVANHLVLLVAAWTAASVALHGLLTFFGDRPAAVAVAHKKFLLARCADACMLGAVVAFGATFDSLRIDVIGAEAMATAPLPAGARIGILLVAVAALLKCAQLPFHGWLIQVMEAPTPVSALLHAGVVNLGGFVLLRFAPVVDRSVETRTLLVVVGVFTAVVASLVMTTRVSVKVALAWSTCAQMGFMLMQCGLGIWEMALLHLLAHSVYKAHAFLGAGGTVRQTQRKRLAPTPPAPDLRSVAVGAGVALLATAGIGLAWELLPSATELSVTVWLMLGIVALALVPLTTPIRSGGHAVLVGRALGVPVAYLALHEVASGLVPHGATAPAALLAFTGLCFGVLFVLQSACIVAPGDRLAQRIRPWVHAGFFLDDAFTRAAFAISPPPSPSSRTFPLPQPTAVVVVPSGVRAVASR
jgi:NAD(P)H-quinone oxidoreductase subunit 5